MTMLYAHMHATHNKTEHSRKQSGEREGVVGGEGRRGKRVRQGVEGRSKGAGRRGVGIGGEGRERRRGGKEGRRD